MSTYIVMIDGAEVLRYEADMDQSASGVYTVDEYGDAHSTPYQVADGCHDRDSIAALLRDWLDSEGCAPWDAGTTIDVAPLTDA